MKIWTLLIVLNFSIIAEWVTDSEPYGFLGCKQLQYQGSWESEKDTVNKDESVDGVCISVALANILIYYKWPLFSRFDNIYLTTSYDGIIIKIDQRWNYSLITGSRTASDCETDSPRNRHLPDNPLYQIVALLNSI